MGGHVARRLRHALAAGTATALSVLLLAPTASADSPSCVISARQTATAASQPAPLRFGIYPGGPAGSVNPKAPPRPEDPAKRLAALQGLRGDNPFVVRLYSGWTGDARADDVSGWLDDEIRQYTGAGLQVELVVRYKPERPDAGSPAGFAAFVRGLVRRYGGDPAFTSLQVTNEANLDNAPDASDGAFAGAVQAVVDGVVAAKDEAVDRGHDQVRVGFSWAYDERPAASSEFWAQLRRLGGSDFARSVDWVGLDTYPGTWTPQLPSSAALPGQAGAAVTEALRALRDCYLPMAGLGPSTTIHVAENGFPTGAGRGDEMQSEVLDAMVRAVDAVRGTYGVSDYRWFDLRDSSTADTSLESHYGITRDDYTPKAAFHTYRDLIDELSSGGPAGELRPRTVTARVASCVPARVRLALSRRAGARMTGLTVRVGDRVVKTLRGVPRAVGLSLPRGRSAVALRLRGKGRVRVRRHDLRVC
jgi:hypothetical protein